MKRAKGFAAQRCSFRVSGLFARSLPIHMDKGIEFGLRCFDAVKMRLDNFQRRKCFCPDTFTDLCDAWMV